MTRPAPNLREKEYKNDVLNFALKTLQIAQGTLFKYIVKLWVFLTHSFSCNYFTFGCECSMPELPQKGEAFGLSIININQLKDVIKTKITIFSQ